MPLDHLGMGRTSAARCSELPISRAPPMIPTMGSRSIYHRRHQCCAKLPLPWAAASAAFNPWHFAASSTVFCYCRAGTHGSPFYSLPPSWMLEPDVFVRLHGFHLLMKPGTFLWGAVSLPVSGFLDRFLRFRFVDARPAPVRPFFCSCLSVWADVPPFLFPRPKGGNNFSLLSSSFNFHRFHCQLLSTTIWAAKAFFNPLPRSIRFPAYSAGDSSHVLFRSYLPP